MNGNDCHDFSINSSSDGNNTITDENYTDNINTNNKLEDIEAIQIETKFSTGRWTNEEHVKFIEAMFLYGNEWKRVQEHIKTRSSTQARSHAQKFFIRLKKKLLGEKIEHDHKDKSLNKRNELIMSWIQENINSDTIKNISNRLDNLYIEKRDKLCKIIMNLLDNPIKRKSPKLTTIKNCCAIGGRNRKDCTQICCINESEFIKEYENSIKRKCPSAYSINTNNVINDENEIFRIEKINKESTPLNNYSFRTADNLYVNQNNYINMVTINLSKEDETKINAMNNRSRLFTEDDKNDPFKLSFCESPTMREQNNDVNLNFDLEQFFNVDNFLN
jgi:SHAQKYF class myb-like DNA-binding protein